MRFHTPMDRASVETALTLTPGLSGTFIWQDDYRVTFTPVSYWALNTAYTATLATSARDTGGQRMLLEDQVWQFRTGAAPRTEAAQMLAQVSFASETALDALARPIPTWPPSPRPGGSTRHPRSSI